MKRKENKMELSIHSAKTVRSEAFSAAVVEKDWTGKRYMWWNPSSSYFQNVSCKLHGAEAAARVLKSYGLDAWADSRLD